MKVDLKPGEKVAVTFFESDGEITVEFNENDISVKADLSDKSGREGVIYLETFGPTDEEVEIHLVQTCGAYPEQYDAFAYNDGLKEQVGYFRLRNGNFYVQCPDTGGQTVYATADIKGDGMFEPDERDTQLELGKAAVRRWVKTFMPHMVKGSADG